MAGGKITANLTCSATVLPNPNVLSFQYPLNLEGFVPQNPFHLTLTDIGNAVQPVMIFLNPSGTVTQHRIGTRAITLNRVSRK